MSEHDVLKKNRNFYIGVGGTVLEGLLSGSLFMLLGIAVCLYATRQYQKILPTLNDDEIPAKYRPQWGVAVSYAIAMLSMVLLLSLLIPALHH